MDQGLRSTRLRPRVFRLVGVAALLVLVFAAMRLVPPWIRAVFPDLLIKRFILRLLLASQFAYGVLLPALPVALIALTVALLRARRRGARRPLLARGLAVCVAVVVASAMSEGVAAAWLTWSQLTAPRLPTRFSDPPARITDGDEKDARDSEALPTGFGDRADDETLDIIVLGESSACGVPYHKWLSVGRIVAWKLQEALPHRRFRVEHVARPGITLEGAHKLMSGLVHRPDLVILYAGHNEFDVRYNWGLTPVYYVDDTPPTPVALESAGRNLSPICRLIQQTIEIYQISLPPPPHVFRPLVDVPVYTAAEYTERLHDFRTRLEAIVSYCERLGALVVLVAPPSNEADYEPNRSFLLRRTTRPERARFTRDFLAALRTEAVDPIEGIAAYRALLAHQPGFAEAHYRLGRLLEAAGRRDEANQHYVAARDCDGFPVRCQSDFLNAYHEVAARHPRAILVDGPEVLRKLSPRGTLGDDFIADGHHPSLIGYSALSQWILQELHARRAFDWPVSSPIPVVSPPECAAHFGMDPGRWRAACYYIKLFYDLTAYIRYDPSQRIAKADRYKEAIRRIDEGISPETIQLSGVGTRPLPARSHMAVRETASDHN